MQRIDSANKYILGKILLLSSLFLADKPWVFFKPWKNK